MVWLLYFPFMMLAMVLCYATNWFVCLFADENGELPHVFRMWQTWDDSTNPRCHVMEMAPKFLRYDWDKHYIEYIVEPPELKAIGQKRWVAKCINDDFTLEERIKRYLCRVLWLTRNCAYSFAFWCFGNDVKTAGVKEKVYLQKKTGRQLTIGWDTSKKIWNRPWWIKCDWAICRKLEWNTYLGWKWYMSAEDNKHCMIANRIAVRITK